MPNHLDLYAAHGLDRRSASTELTAQLTTQLNNADPRDLQSRARIEIARAILADPQRRASYDAQLADPTAPPITEQTLAAMAGQPTPAPLASGLTSVFTQPRAKILAGVACVLVLLLVVLIAVVTSRGGSDDKDDTAAGTNSVTGSAGDTKGEVCWPINTTRVAEATWSKGEKMPSYAILLTAAYDLPATFAPIADRTNGFSAQYTTATFGTEGGLTQYQDKSIGVLMGTSRSDKNGAGYDATMDVAIIGQDGKLVSTRRYTEDEKGDIPKAFDLANKSTTGYYRIVAETSIEIPASAAGDTDQKSYALSVMPDAFDEEHVWILMRGSSKLYKAAVYSTSGAHTPSIAGCGTYE